MWPFSKREKNIKVDLDRYIVILDEERKVIDGPHYREGNYWVYRCNTYNNRPCITTSSKSLARWIARYYGHYRHLYGEIFSSNEICGKFIYDRQHAKRFYF